MLNYIEIFKIENVGIIIIIDKSNIQNYQQIYQTYILTVQPNLSFNCNLDLQCNYSSIT